MQSACQRELFLKTPASSDKTQKCYSYFAKSVVSKSHIAVSFAVKENLSVSTGMSTVEFEDTSKVDQEDTGFSISYTMGSMTIAAAANASDNAGGSNGTDDTHKEMSIAFAF